MRGQDETCTEYRCVLVLTCMYVSVLIVYSLPWAQLCGQLQPSPKTQLTSTSPYKKFPFVFIFYQLFMWHLV